ncbi:hypothetical protein Peur_004566 [Populus x canadensis]
MAKSKKKSSVLRSAQQDYDYCSSRPSSSNAPWALSRSVSPAIQRPSSPSRTSPPTSNPPRATVALADVVISQRLSRVRTKNRIRGIRHTPSAASPLSSPHRCRPHASSPDSSQPRCGPLGEPGSPYPRPGVGNPNFEATTGAAASPPSHRPGKAPTVSHRSSSPVYPTGTPTVPQSPPLVHFPSYTTTSSCTLLDTDVGMYKDRWRFCLIGFIAGKFPGYTSLSSFINSSWKRNVNFSMHDSGWLIFNFDSEMDMLEVLNGGPYSVHGRLLILKIMPEFFDFDTSEMLRMPVWIRFPNLPLQCWSPICLSKLASVIGKPIHLDTPTSSMSRHKRRKRGQPTPTPSGCSNPSAETEAVEKQPLREEPQGEPECDPMFAEAAVAGEERPDISACKRAKLATPSGPLGDHPPASPPVVTVEDETNAALPPRRQYLTRSKAAATSGRSGKALWKNRSSNNSSSAVSLGNIASASSSST